MPLARFGHMKPIVPTPDLGEPQAHARRKRPSAGACVASTPWTCSFRRALIASLVRAWGLLAGSTW